jgi:hypothetical protein
VLEQLRDEILVHTEQGRHYIDLYERYSADLATVILPGTMLWDDGFDTLDLCLPLLESLLDGSADESVITGEHVEAVVGFLNNVATAAAGSELAAAIEAELDAMPLEPLVGRSMAQAQAALLGNAPPTVDCSLVPRRSDNHYRVSFSATDDSDAAPEVLATVGCGDSSRTVGNGQRLKFKPDDVCGIKTSAKMIKVDGPAVELVVTATDDQGGSDTCTATVVGRGDDDDDDEEDENDDD